MHAYGPTRPRRGTRRFTSERDFVDHGRRRTGCEHPSLVGEVLDLLTDLAHQGTTMLIATHEMNFARDVAHEVAYLDKGVLVEKGTPEKMFGSPDHEATKNFLSRVR